MSNLPNKKIWNKMTAEQKKAYKVMYRQFENELMELFSYWVETVAHNLALIAIGFIEKK